jgi:hypothetical protein
VLVMKWFGVTEVCEEVEEEEATIAEEEAVV